MSPLLLVQQPSFPRNEVFLHVEYVLIWLTKHPSLYVTWIKHKTPNIEFRIKCTMLILDSNRSDICITGVTLCNSDDLTAQLNVTTVTTFVAVYQVRWQPYEPIQIYRVTLRTPCVGMVNLVLKEILPLRLSANHLYFCQLCYSNKGDMSTLFWQQGWQ